MRRRRRVLQVSLFPFLAVLLCVLGSLVLLLLVLDQKARQSAAEEAERNSARFAQADANAERELQRRLQALLDERDNLAARAVKLQDEHRRQHQRLNAQKRELAALHRQATSDEAQSDADRLAAARALEQGVAVEKQRADVQSGIAGLEEQIRSLEEAVRQLTEVKNQAKPPVYSLVPYKGRQGTSRRPIYVECINDHAVFRPAGNSPGTRLSSQEVRSGTRFAELVKDHFAQLPSSATDGMPYVLLLIRPSGIPVYYSVVRALHNSNVELGYEFLDEEWALDLTPSPAGPSRLASAAKPSTPASASASKSPAKAAPAAARPTRSPMNTPARSAPAGDSPWTAPPRPVLAAPQPAARAGAFGAVQTSDRTDVESAKPRNLVPDGGEREPANPTFLKPIFTNPAGKPLPRKPVENQRGAEPPAAEAGRDERVKQPSEGNLAEKTRAADRPRGLKPGGLSRSASSEWVIVIECSGTTVAVQGQPLAVEPAALAGGRADNPLAHGIQELIETRRKKRPDVQPKLKYLIHPDGLRNYYLASGALQSLKLPATWQTLEEKVGDDAREGGPQREP